MATFWRVALVLSFAAFNALHVEADRAEVRYLGGIVFLLDDGCPEGSDESSIQAYNACIQTGDLHMPVRFLLENTSYPEVISFSASEYSVHFLHHHYETVEATQCVTDTLPTGSKLTVPVYTDTCSAICHGKSSSNCPFNGSRLDGKGSAGSDNVNKPLADQFLGK